MTLKAIGQDVVTTDAEVRRARYAVAVTFLLNGGLLGSWAPQIPLVKARLGLSDGDLGIALLVLSLGAVIAMPFSGAVIARTGSAWPTRISIALMAFALPATVLAPDLVTFHIAAFLFGAGTGLSDVAVNTHAVEVERRIGKPIMSGLHGMFSLGGFAASALGGFILATHTPVTHMIVIGLISLAGLAYALPGFLSSDVDRGAAGGGLALPGRSVALIALGTFLIFMAEGAMIDWSAVWMSTVLLTSPGTAAAAYAAFAGGMAIGRFAGDIIRQSFSAVLLVRLGALTAAVALGLGLLSAYVPVIIVALAITGLGLSNIVPVLFVAAGKTPGQPAATGVAAVATTGYAGLLLGPPLIGFASEQVGLTYALAALAIGCLVTALIAGSARPADIN